MQLKLMTALYRRLLAYRAKSVPTSPMRRYTDKRGAPNCVACQNGGRPAGPHTAPQNSKMSTAMCTTCRDTAYTAKPKDVHKCIRVGHKSLLTAADAPPAPQLAPATTPRNATCVADPLGEDMFPND